ncbi:IS110 family transposase [Nostoc sp. LEGE 06077]|uniref:IS110 family transposase n=1 Tax=Nostoc sp. LEGE 06077 TaxID=915325 RepID=UPI0018825187|nr:IS110 family transposase [Nostoc sp. LEGE 06077]MBE9211100.1 IS110 family transposase [Nostoc sp. LEGE 06077]
MNKQDQNSATLLRYCVGIDVSKDNLQVCVSLIDTNGKVTIKGSGKINNKTTAFESFLTWVDKHCKDKSLPVRFVMESTGVYHEQLAWYLFQKDLAVSVVLPNKAKHYLKSIGNKSKNDSIDARGLAQMGLEQNLKLWKPLSKNIYQLRMLTRHYQTLQELKNQSENQQHAILHSQVIDKFTLKHLEKLIRLYDQQIDETKQQIAKLIEKDTILKPKIEQLCQIKGLGLLSVATIIAETNGFTGFENIRQLVSFSGYDVVENQSGNRVGKTRISKKGSSRIRRILHLPAFNAVRFGEPSCQALFERVFERTQIKMKGYVAVQKKLLTKCYAIWKNDTQYDPNYNSNNVKEQKNMDKKIVPTSGTMQDIAA